MLILALTLSAGPAPQAPRTPRSGILITASIGFGVMGVGAGVELSAHRSIDPRAEFFLVAGRHRPLIVLIAALLTRWYMPHISSGVRW